MTRLHRTSVGATAAQSFADWPGFFQAIPKIELHCHLLGTIQEQTFRELAVKSRAPISSDEISKYYVRGEKPVGVLKAFRTIERHLLSTVDHLYRLTIEYLQSLSEHRVRYAEFFWNPTGALAHANYTFAQAQEAIAAAIIDARASWGVESRLIVAIDREASVRSALEVVALAVAHRSELTIGLGIDYRENDRPPRLFAEAYKMARSAGLKTTAHAGEFGMHWSNVAEALDILKVDRIDHGYTIIESEDLVRRCVQEGRVFTVVPTNSYYLRTLPRERWALDHPIRHMPGLGLKIHPNTDDPALHLTTPTNSWLMMSRDFGFDLSHIREFMLNGLDGAWIDDSTRRRWRSEFLQAFDDIERKYLSSLDDSQIQSAQ